MHIFRVAARLGRHQTGALTIEHGLIAMMVVIGAFLVIGKFLTGTAMD
jgi:Flp pilus assembly pilin Flp